MTVSKEVQAAVDKVREMKDYIKADKEADKLRDKQLADAKAAQEQADAKLSALQAKLDGLQVNRELSQEDKDALQHAFEDAQEASTAATEAQENVAEVHDELKDAVPQNTKPDASSGSSGSSEADDEAKRRSEEAAAERRRIADMTPEEMAEDRGKQKEAGQREMPGSDTQTANNGPSNFPAGESAPLMPTLAFNPHGTGNPAPAGDGQPGQAQAIETAGGFVIQGGASTQRAPGSRPDSPSSSLVIPDDPTAKGPASTADEVKSGLGDSRGNELIGNDLQPVDQGPGMPKETTDAEREAAQKHADLAAEEMARREANPLNLSPEDLKKREDEAKANEQAREDKVQGKPNADTGPAPSPQEARPETEKPAV